MLKPSSPKLADEVAQIAVQAVEHGSEHDAVAFRGRSPREGQLPMHTRPTHQAEHHAERRQEREQHSDAKRPLSAPAQSMERTDTGWNEHERKDAVEGPGGASSRTGRQQGREHILRAPIQHFRILKTSGEVREHAEKRHRARDERDAAGENRSPCISRFAQTFMNRHAAHDVTKQDPVQVDYGP